MTNETTASERERFEAWARAKTTLSLTRHPEEAEEYFRASTDSAWIAWQARAALPAPVDQTPSQEAREYPPLPEADAWPLGPAVPFFGPEKMRSYVDADRKARQQEALDARRYRMKRNIDERNFKESNIYKHSNEALRDMLLDGWRASYDTAIDAAIAKGEHQP